MKKAPAMAMKKAAAPVVLALPEKEVRSQGDCCVDAAEISFREVTGVKGRRPGFTGANGLPSVYDTLRLTIVGALRQYHRELPADLPAKAEQIAMDKGVLLVRAQDENLNLGRSTDQGFQEGLRIRGDATVAKWLNALAKPRTYFGAPTLEMGYNLAFQDRQLRVMY